MTRLTGLAKALVLLALLPAFSGCLTGGSDDGGPKASASASSSQDPSDSESPAPSPSPTSSGSSSPSPTKPPAGESPEAKISVSGPNVTETEDGYEALAGDFVLSGSESAGDIESYAWDFGDGSSGDGETVDHSYPEAGSYEIVLTVIDTAGLEDSASVTLTVTVPAPPPAGGFAVEDPAGDSELDAADLVKLEMSDDGSVLTVVFTFEAVQPTAPTLSNIMPSLFLNDLRYEPYAAATPDALCGPAKAVYGYGEGAVIKDSTVAIDSTTNAWTITMPLENIQAELPFVLYVDVRASPEPCGFGGDGSKIFDRAPDDGTATYP